MEQRQVFAHSQLVQLFPTCVWLHDLRPEAYEPINRRILPVIAELVERHGSGLQGATW